MPDRSDRRPLPTSPLWAASAALCVFLIIAACVSTGLASGFDTAVVLAFRRSAEPKYPIGPEWLQEAVRDITALGSNVVSGTLLLAAVILLALAGRRRSSVFLLASFGGALALQGGFKMLIARPRPELVPHAARVFSSSFPSSHATVAAAVALSIAVLLSRARPDIHFHLTGAAICGSGWHQPPLPRRALADGCAGGMGSGRGLGGALLGISSLREKLKSR